MDEFVWDDDQFKFNEKEVKGNYDYLVGGQNNNSGSSQDQIKLVYEACVNFLKNGTVPKHINEHTLKSLSVFGLQGFREQDRVKLVRWATAICKLDQAIRKKKGRSSFLPQTGDAGLFNRLVTICQQIIA